MNVCFLTVLKTGGEFNFNHVNSLYKQIEKYYADNFNFICLTDNKEGLICKSKPLRYNWPGWWAKMEIFNFCLANTIYFYLDLDTVIVKDISHIVNYPHKFTVLQEATLNHGMSKNIGSGLMAWRGDYSYLFEVFAANAQNFMLRHKIRGDQEFLQANLSNYDFFQKLFKGFYSYKFTLQNKDILPNDTRIIYFHGKPRPWEIENKHNWLKRRYT